MNQDIYILIRLRKDQHATCFQINGKVFLVIRQKTWEVARYPYVEIESHATKLLKNKNNITSSAFWAYHEIHIYVIETTVGVISVAYMERQIDINSSNKRALKLIRELSNSIAGLSNSIKECSYWIGKLSNWIRELSIWIAEHSNSIRELQLQGSLYVYN